VTQALADRLKKYYPSLDVVFTAGALTEYDIIVNATPLGMNENDPLPLDISSIEAKQFVGEVVMKKEITPFLKAAQARGCQIQVGTDMLFEQIPAYLEFFNVPSCSAEHLREIAKIQYL